MNYNELNTQSCYLYTTVTAVLGFNLGGCSEIKKIKQEVSVRPKIPFNVSMHFGISRKIFILAENLTHKEHSRLI